MFNAALKDELEVIKQIEKLEDLAETLCEIIDKSLKTEKLSNKQLRAIEKCYDLSESIDSLEPLTQKDICNPVLEEEDLEQIFIQHE